MATGRSRTASRRRDAGRLHAHRARAGPGQPGQARRSPTWTRSISRENLANRIRSKLVAGGVADQLLEGQGGPGPRLFLVSQDVPRPGRRGRWPCSRSTRPSSARPSGSTARSSASMPAASRPATSRSSNAIRWDAENTLVVRIGAHPAVLPDTYPDRLGLREDQVDARHLRQRVADLLRQPGDRDHPGRAAHRHGRDRRADQA